MNAIEVNLAIVRQAERRQPGRYAVAPTPREVLSGMWAEVAPELGRLAAAMGVPSHRVEDLLQEVFLAAWQNGPDETVRIRLKRWLIRVTVNRCNLEHRRRKRWKLLLDQLARFRTSAKTVGSARQAAIQHEERELVRRALDELQPDRRSVLVLRYYQQYDSKEIGRILDMPHSTVRGHLRKARRALARGLIQAGYEHDADEV